VNPSEYDLRGRVFNWFAENGLFTGRREIQWMYAKKPCDGGSMRWGYLGKVPLNLGEK